MNYPDGCTGISCTIRGPSAFGQEPPVLDLVIKNQGYKVVETWCLPSLDKCPHNCKGHSVLTTPQIAQKCARN